MADHQSALFVNTYYLASRRALSSCKRLRPTAHNLHRGAQCFELKTDVYNNLHRDLQIDALLIAFVTVFNRVAHKHLIYKMKMLKKQASVYKRVGKCSTWRCQVVLINDVHSSFQLFKYAVPQGFFVRSTLFSTYIIGSHVSLKYSILLIADECVMYRHVSKFTESIDLLIVLQKISNWCTKWKMPININKAKFMHLTTNNKSLIYNYAMNSDVLQTSKSFKYLKVLFPSNFCCCLHNLMFAPLLLHAKTYTHVLPWCGLR